MGFPARATRRGSGLLAGVVGVAALVGSAMVLGGCGESAPMPGEPIRVRVAFGEVGVSPGQFSYPRAMDAQVDGSGSWLWVVDKSGRVQKIDAATGACRAWWRMPAIALGKPTGITIGPAAGPGLAEGDAGRAALWLADTHYHQVLVYDAADAEMPGPGREPTSPRVLARFGEYGEAPGQFVYVTDVALLLDAAGAVERVYVSEYGGNDRITCLDGEFNVLFTFGAFGSGEAAERVEFNRPQAIGIDALRDELIVVDSCNHRIGRFTLDGELVAWIGSPESAGDELGRFRYPWGLYLPGDGTALVVEQQGARVQHIDLATGAALASYGRIGYGEGELVTPWSVTVIGEMAYVLDSGNNRIFGFAAPRVREPRVASGVSGGVDGAMGRFAGGVGGVGTGGTSGSDPEASRGGL